MPDGVAAVLIARLDRLTAQVRAVVQTAAVLGQEFEVPVLSEMLHDDAQLPAKLERAQAESIWQSLTELRYLFRHALLRMPRMPCSSASACVRYTPPPRLPSKRSTPTTLPRSRLTLPTTTGRPKNTTRERHYARVAGERPRSAMPTPRQSRILAALWSSCRTTKRGSATTASARENLYDLLGLREAQTQDVDAITALAEQLGNDERRARAALRHAHYAATTGEYTAAIDAAQHAIALATAAGDRVE